MMTVNTQQERKRKVPVGKWIITVIFWVIGFSMLIPLVWMISTSFKFESDVFTFPIQWIPTRTNIVENYKTVWGSEYNFAMYYWNSIKVTVLTTVAQVTVSAMGAYGFSKINWKHRDKLFLLYLGTMMIPPQVTIVSTFIVNKMLGLYDTHLGIILMLSFSVYGVFLLRQAMVAIPLSLSESATIDGAGHFTIFTRIILPLTKPSLATLAILKFVWTWNDYQTPLVFLKSRELFTIQLGMKQFQSEAGSYYSLVMAAAVSAIVPLVIVFLAGQRHVIDGIASGAVKG